MLEIEQWVQHRDEVAAEDALNRWGEVPSLVPAHTLVIAKIRHKHDGKLRLPGQVYWMPDERVAPNVDNGLIEVATRVPYDFWNPEGRILGVEDVSDVKPWSNHWTPGALKILAGVGYDPGSAAFRLHTAVNEYTKHSMLFVRWADSNPYCSLRQLDGEKDIGKVRDAFEQADVLHCHVAYLLINNVGLMPTTDQLIIRHYHGSQPKGGTHMEPLFDKAKGVKLLGARLSLVAEGERFDMDIDWSPIPMPVMRYRKLRNQVRRQAGWRNIRSKATPKRKLRIGHSPTNMAIKGTDVLKRVVDRLQQRHVPVELDLIHGLKLREALERKALCDVIFDSFWLGIQGSGLEAGAMEIPVIAGDQDVATLYRRECGHVPYSFADSEQELEMAIEQMAMDPDWRERETQTVANYVSIEHDYRAVARRYERSLAKWMGRDDILTESA